MLPILVKWPSHQLITYAAFRLIKISPHTVSHEPAAKGAEATALGLTEDVARRRQGVETGICRPQQVSPLAKHP